MSTITDFLKKPAVVGEYVASVIKSKFANKSVYNLTFVKEESGYWYIDLPEWNGSHANLAMVAGSDVLLEHLLKDGNMVEVEVVKSNVPLDGMEDYFCCKQVEMSLLGATYEVYGVDGFDGKIWICPVTLFVFGEYPKYMYISQKL